MSKLPVISGRELVKALQQVGFVLILMLMGLVLYFDFMKIIPAGLFSSSEEPLENWEGTMARSCSLVD